MDNGHHILGSAGTLLGIALLIITGLHMTNQAMQTAADELAWFAAGCFSASCIASYLSIRAQDGGRRSEILADRFFLLGLVALFGSVAIFATGGGHA
jgi:hypothetical protein